MEAAPRIPHAEFVKIARSVADFPDSDFDATRIVAPALVVHGEHVPGALRTVHDRLVASLTNADVETTVVPDAGHASNVDNPASFTETVRTFTRRVRSEDS